MNALDSKQFALGVMFMATVMIASVIGLASQFELQGFAVGIDICVLLWTLASFSNVQTLRPFSNRCLTITEVATLVAICLILHGLAMPPVHSTPHLLPEERPSD